MAKLQSVFHDAFISLISGCNKSLLIPIINEIYATHYAGEEEILVHGNQISIKSNNGWKSYVLIVEYGPDDSIALFPCELIPEISSEVPDKPTLTGTSISVASTGILYLRGHVPYEHKLDLRPKICSTASMMGLFPVKSMYDYSEDELFTKRLYLLLPFFLASDPPETLYGNRLLADNSIEYTGKIKERLMEEVKASHITAEDASTIKGTWEHLLQTLWMDFVYTKEGNLQE